MSKRKLNRQQQWRIEKIQQERSARATRKERNLDQDIAAGELGEAQAGLVIAHFGQQLDVEALEGPLLGEIIRCVARTNLDALVTGDRVVWRPASDGMGVIEARQPRHSELMRPDNFGQIKPIAANIDTIFLVIAPEPLPHDNLIDRYLVAAETTGVKPVILLNKCDLILPGSLADQTLTNLLARYQALGYPVIRSSAIGESSAALNALLQGKTSVFVGQSGVGKSSLVQQLLPDISVRIGALSETTRKGTHTTTTARLFHLQQGGDLIDSPGIREFGLWHIAETDLEAGFIEIYPLLGHCRFRNCKHQSEPGCAITQAAASGRISAERLASFKRILQDIRTQRDANPNWL